MTKSNKKLTVITVSYQAEKTIESTIKSVLEQEYTNFEYLIVDGASSDNTVNIVKEYKNAFKKIGIEYNFISEPDKGIYNVMNKASVLAKGEYVLFLNADDALCSPKVLSTVVNIMEQNPDCDIFYGDMINSFYGVYSYITAGTVDKFKITMPFCHQCVFTRRSLLCERPYDEDFKLFADHDFYLWCYLQNKKFLQMDIPVSIYSSTGFSGNAKYVKARTEHYKIHLKNGLINKEEYFNAVNNLKHARWYDFIKRLKHTVPACIFTNKIAEKILSKRGYIYNLTPILNAKFCERKDKE